MPELPELRGYASFINENCAGVVFARVSLSSAARHPPIELPWHRFLISAESRGKELMLRFRESSSSSTASDDRLVQYSFLMGMSGRWDFVPSSLLVDEETKLANKLKHAHVLFESADQLYTLCFVDTRRFGRWTPSPEGWSAERGPDPTTEYDAFEANVLSGLESCSRSFQRPVCELLLDQRYFNGVGNYLRAEILYRAGVTDPFRSAHQVLLECPQILPLCRDVCNEVIERNLLNDHEYVCCVMSVCRCRCVGMSVCRCVGMSVCVCVIQSVDGEWACMCVYVCIFVCLTCMCVCVFVCVMCRCIISVCNNQQTSLASYRYCWFYCS
mmetsp:Transcript_36870/g.92421  ORF Transcript_36870/g.92421 Transcript_36870/m.92421 type:complete len:328 (+) Transcript_36870:147-1130(+)